MKKIIFQLLAIIFGLFLISGECNPEAATVYSISATPSSFTFTSMAAGYITPPSAQTVNIKNDGMGRVTLNYLPTPPAGYSFTTSLLLLDLEPGETAKFSIRPNTGLGAGTYNATFKITGNNGVSVTISPSFTVTSPSPIPTLSVGTVERANETVATIGFNSSQGGTAYYRVQAYGAATPTSAWVTGGTSLGAVSAGSTFGKTVNYATPGPWDIYVVVENTSGMSAPFKIPAPFAGSGQPTDPYLISTQASLVLMRDLVNANANSGHYRTARYYQQTADISLSGVEWGPYPIGTGTYPFQGVYNGNGKTISNLTQTTSNYDSGLFGYVNTAGALIQNVRLEGVTIEAGNNVGGLLATLDAGKVQNCRVVREKIKGTQNAGGIAGLLRDGGTIENCYVSGVPAEISSWTTNQASIGGILGRSNANTTLRNCYTTALLYQGYDCGGVVGHVDGLVEYCYATGAIETIIKDACVGGVAGCVYSGGIVRNCIGLNNSIKATDTKPGYFGRVTGYVNSGGQISSNYGRQGMQFNPPRTIDDPEDRNSKDGYNTTAGGSTNYYNSSFYTDTIHSYWWNNIAWSFSTIWTITTKLPILIVFSSDTQVPDVAPFPEP